MENLRKGDKVTSTLFKEATVRKATPLGQVEVEYKNNSGASFIRLVPKEAVKKLN